MFEQSLILILIDVLKYVELLITINVDKPLFFLSYTPIYMFEF